MSNPTSEAAAPGQRVVLVKPGDLLLIGNIGDSITTDEHGNDVLSSAVEFFRTLGISVVFFAADIRLDLLPPGATSA